MDRSTRQSQLKVIIETHWGPIYDFAFRMTLDRSRAAAIMEETFLRTYLGQDRMPENGSVEGWLLRICNHVLQQSLPRTPELSLEVIDDTVRSRDTREQPVHSLTDPEHTYTLWEHEQGCMTAVVNSLSPDERAAFVLANVIGLEDDAAATALGASKSAYKVRLSKAQKKLTDHLAPRCEFVASANPCHCQASIGHSARREEVDGDGVNGRPDTAPFDGYGSAPGGEDEPLAEVQRIYRSLPQPRPGSDIAEALVAKLEAGEWDDLLPVQQEA